MQVAQGARGLSPWKTLRVDCAASLQGVPTPRKPNAISQILAARFAVRGPVFSCGFV
jgi:hypothetical protein